MCTLCIYMIWIKESGSFTWGEIHICDFYPHISYTEYEWSKYAYTSYTWNNLKKIIDATYDNKHNLEGKGVTLYQLKTCNAQL
jgi:hypothetical protein